MNTYEEAYERFTTEMKEMGIHFHEELYQAIMKYLGPSVYQKDAGLVACSDPKELEAIKKNFLMGKLEMEDSPKLDTVINEVCEAMGSSNRNKHRVTFYYLLTAILGKEGVFIEQKGISVNHILH